MKQILWKFILDPVVRRIESRLKHFQSLQKITHDGGRWTNIASMPPCVTFFPDAQLINFGKRDNLVIGEHCHIRGELSVTGGVLTLGSYCYIGAGSRIWCSNRVAIGSHVLISHGVDIHDNDSHSFNFAERREEGIHLFKEGRLSEIKSQSAPVIIEDDVWICLKSTILKGVTIGRGAVVAAGSVVTKNVEPFTLVAGTPAKMIRKLPEST